MRAGGDLGNVFHPSRARPGIVARTALVERLAAATAPVITVTAPPGYGKTTLMAQWARRINRAAPFRFTRQPMADQARTRSPAGACPPSGGSDGLHPLPPLLGGHRALVHGDVATLVPPRDVHNHGHVAGSGPSPYSLILLGDDMLLFDREEYDPEKGTWRALAPGNPGRDNG